VPEPDVGGKQRTDQERSRPVVAQALAHFGPDQQQAGEGEAAEYHAIEAGGGRRHFGQPREDRGKAEIMIAPAVHEKGRP
jgi:hypothetical protein